MTAEKPESTWSKLNQKTNSISLRERLLVAFAGLVLIYGLAELLYFDQLRQEHKKLDAKMERLKKDRGNYENELRVLSIKKDKPRQLQAQIDLLDKKIRNIEDEILGFSEVMTGPSEMTAILKGILEQRGELSILSLKNLKAKPVRYVGQEADANDTEKKSDASEELTIGLYRHSLEIILEGPFDAAKEFVKKVEDENSNIYWESAEYEVLEYPKGKLTIRVFTLSRDKEWIGV